MRVCGARRWIGKMPLPRYGMWDRLCASLRTAPPGFDAPLPHLGALGRRMRRRGVGYVLGASLRIATTIWGLDLRSKRLRVLLRRHRWSLLLVVGWIALCVGVGF